MPLPGVGNNPTGNNVFSGPLGQKEPAYGLAERMKILDKIGVKPPPGVGAPKRAQRAASKGKTVAAAPEPQIVPEAAPVASYDQELASFWTQMAQTPGASPLVQQIASQGG